jgi:hypothetical protein
MTVKRHFVPAGFGLHIIEFVVVDAFVDEDAIAK